MMHVIARMNVGGPALEISELMRGLDADRFEQLLITGWCADDEADYLDTQAPDIPAMRVPGFGRAIRPTEDALVLPRLVRQIRAFRPHVVHTHTAKAGVLGRIATKAALVNARIVHTHHGHLLHGYFGPRKTAALIRLERQLSRHTETVVTVGEQVRDDLLARGIGRPDQYSVIRSGVRLGPIPDRDTSRGELGIPDGAIVVTMVGRITKIKRPDRFADVVALTTAQGANLHYLVAGGGDLEPYLRARVERERLPVTMLGWRSDLERILAATDIALLTSDNEGTPLSLVQAALAGVPAVATDVGSVSEVVENDVTGLLVETSAEALSEAVTLLARDSPVRAQMGKSARDRASSAFSMLNFLSEHERTYSAVANRH